MALLFNSRLEEELSLKLSETNSCVLILSAFTKMSALDWLQQHLAPGINVTIISRWQIQDLLCGASDLAAYEFASKNGWTFAINTNMHYKIYLIDNETLFLGSANLTRKGLHLDLKGNDEASIQTTPSEIDLIKLEQYAADCCVINDDLYTEMKECVELNQTTQQDSTPRSWPSSIKDRIVPEVKQLWVNDMLFNTPQSIQADSAEFGEHDIYTLGLSTIADLNDKNIVLTGLRSTAVWKWLLKTIKSSEHEFVRFGEITTQLHDALVDDPKPYRKDVKNFLSNLYEWIRYVNPSEIGLKKFHHTEALFIKGKVL